MNKTILTVLFMFTFVISFSQVKYELLEKAIKSKDSSDFYFKKFKKTATNPSKIAAYLSCKTEYFDLKTQYDSAIFYGLIAIEKTKKINDLKTLYQLYYTVALNYRRQGQYEKGQEYILNGMTIAEKNKEIDYIIKYNTFLSLNYHDFESYEKGVFYGKKTIKLLDLHKKYTLEDRRYALNAIAINYDDWNKPDSALFYHYKVVKLAKGVDLLKIDQTYNNIGNTLLKQKQFSTARKWLLKSNNATDFKFAGKTKDIKFNYQKSTVINNLANIAYELGEYSQAEKLFDSSYHYSTMSKNAEKMRDYYYHRAMFNKKRHNFEEAVHYQDDYIKLRDSIFDGNRAKIFDELEAKYQSEKKEKELLQFKNRNIQNELQIKKKNSLFIISSIVALGFLIIGFLIYRQQKLKNQQQSQEFELMSAIEKIESQNKLQEQRLSISRDLHDNIGSQLTFIISSVDNVKYGFDIQNEKLESKLTGISSFAKDTIVELRDTVWAMNSNEISFEDLEIRISNFIEKAKISKENISFSFAIEDVLKTKKLTSVEGMNIYRTIQEAINNSLKYANADIISVNIKRESGKSKIIISDNGQGFDVSELMASDLAIKGNGLNNMKKRIEEIGGTFDLLSSESGTRIEILV